MRNLGGTPSPVGFLNYITLFHDPVFLQAAINTFYFTFASVPLGMILSLIVALLLNRPLRLSAFFRTSYFAPVVTSTVAVSLVWSLLFDPHYGVLDFLLSAVGLHGIGWLEEPGWAMLGIIVMSVWKGLGWNMVVYLAGLQAIPEHLYEAARIDGASNWQQFWGITWPLLSPTTFFILIMSVISSFQVFDQVFVMTGGGPMNSTNVIVFDLYQQAFQFFRMGYASAMAYVLFAIIFVVTLVQYKWVGRLVNYDLS